MHLQTQQAVIHSPFSAARLLLAGVAVFSAALAAAPAAGAQTGSEDPPGSATSTFGDSIEVRRLLIDLRVIDGRWRPVVGLRPEDFQVRVDGRPVGIEAVEWWPAEGSAEGGAASGRTSRSAGERSHERAAVELAEPESEPPATESAGLGEAPIETATAPGRLIVLFFQSADFYMEAFAEGHMRLLPRIRSWLGRLPPSDRLAVLRYDGSLTLESDFTTDRGRLWSAVGRAVFGGPPPPDRWGEAPLLAVHFDPERARRAVTSDRALAVTAEALAAIPGPKTMVFAGWGLGVTGTTLEWRKARAALVAARTAVFVLDVTSADYHTLAGDLQMLAAATGGTYASTYPFPDPALHRLDQTLAGRYTLVLKAPRLQPGWHRLHVKLARQARGAGRWVLAPNEAFTD